MKLTRRDDGDDATAVVRWESSEEELLEDARERLRTGVWIMTAAAAVLIAVTVFLGAPDMWIYAAPALVGVWALVRGAMDPRRLIRSDADRIAHDLLRGRATLEAALPEDLEPVERRHRAGALLDALEPPDTFFFRHSRILAPLAIGLGAVAWAAAGVGALVYGAGWGIAAICFGGFALFAGNGVFVKRHNERTDELRGLLEAELEED